jgi:hypothetical protein|tara:strand:+ start:978 stop:1154 length:177 start_codon:yes stop_codon:yes gene_type:complete
MNMKAGDLVKERLPLMAGDAPERLGVIVETPLAGSTFVKVLFDKQEFVPYNSLKKMEA